MFARQQRLTKKRDVQRIYKSGASSASRWLFVRCLPNRLPDSRFTVVIGKKVAKRAVDRNRLKRLVRQAVAELIHDGQILAGKHVDAVLTIHKTPDQPFQLAAAKQEVQKCFDRLPSA